MDQQQYLLGLQNILTQLAFGTGNTEKILEATNTLKTHYFNTPQCVVALSEILVLNPEPSVRQLAAIELRKRVRKWWNDVDASTKTFIRSRLLTKVMEEQTEIVRHAIAQDISAIAEIDVPQGQWPDLLSILYNLCNSPVPAQREIGIYCLNNIFEVLGRTLSEHPRPLFELLAKLLNDPESKIVRETALQTMGNFANFIEPENKDDVRSFKDLVPVMVNVLQQGINDNDEDATVKGFDVFSELLMLEIPVLNTHLPDLVNFLLTVGENKQYTDLIRIQALTVLMSMVNFKQSKLKNLKLIPIIIQRIMPIGSENDPEDIDEDSPSRLAYRVLNDLATNLPPQQVFPIVIEQVINYMQNPNPAFRKSAMMSFAVIMEGSVDYMRPKFNDCLAIVVAGLRDPEVIVRRAACMALGCLAEELDAEIAENHATLLPLIFSLLDDSNPEVTKQACNALDAILEGLGDDINHYLPVLMQKLLYLLDNAPQSETKATVAAAIGSAAHAAGEEFKPYFDEIMKRLKHLMSITGEQDDLLLRGVATDSIGSIAEAVGKEMFRPYVDPLSKLAFDALELQDSRLRECSYCFFAIVARVFQEEFSALLPLVVPHLIKSCQAEEKDELGIEGEFELNTDDFDAETEDALHAFQFNSAVADEKEIAADALGDIFENTRTQFLPWVQLSMTELIKLTQHIAEGVRKAATASLFTFLKTFYVMSNPPAWEAGLPLRYKFAENVENMNTAVMDTIIQMWREEDDRMVVVQICTELVSALNLCGPAVISKYVDVVATHILEIFEKKAPCQIETEDSEDGDDDEEAEHESLLVSAASDLVGAFAIALGPSFVEMLPKFLPEITKYYKKTKSVSDRSMAIGALGDICSGIREEVTNFTEELLPLFIRALSDEEDEVKSNAAFATGVLVGFTRMDLTPQYPNILAALHPLFSNPLENAIDNAAGAVARMILAHPGAVPLDQVIPALIEVIPAKKDYEENEPVFQCIFQLFRSNNPVALSHVPKFLKIFDEVIDSEEQLNQKTRSELVELVRALNKEFPQANIMASPHLAKYL